MAIKAIINNTEKEIEQIKNSNEQDIDYVYSRIGDTEVEGEPPISIKSIGGTLADYRIYGQTVDGESVGDRTGNLFDGTFIHRSVIGAEVSDDELYRRSIVVDISNFNDGDKITFSRETSAGNVFQMYQVSSPFKGGRLLNASVISGDPKTLLAKITLDDISNYHYLMIFLNGASTPISDETLLASKIMINVGNTPLPYEPYGYKVPVTVEGKNLINPSVYEIHNTGVEYTVNNDKSITANGSTSSIFSLFLVKVYLTKGSYIISGCPQNGGQNTYRCEIRDKVLTSLAQDTGAGVTYSIVTDGYYYYSIRIAQNYVCDNITFYPMIRRADIEDDTYEPYHAPVTTPIYLPEQIRKVGDEAEYIDYGEQKLHRVRKNLLQNTAKDREIDVTFTVNSDGSVTCNGTASATVSSDRIPLSLPAGSYYLNGTPSGGSLSTYHMFVWYYNDEFELIWYNDIGDGVSFTIDNSYDVNVGIEIISGYTCNNLIFYPMIRKADIEDDTYEPYIENTDLDVTLPALSTIKGTNTFSVNTSIQPSNMYIKDNFDYKKVFTATRTIEGESPLNYRSIEDNDSTLKNYRIYGQTVDGESVGDRTGNLFDGVIEQGTISADGTLRDVSNRVRTKNFTVLDAGTYTIQSSNNVGEISVFIFTYTDDGTFIERLPSDWVALPYSFTLSEHAKVKIVFEYTRGEAINPSDVKNIMLNSGSTALPYEPYGYKVPVTVEGKNLFDFGKWSKNINANDDNSLVKGIDGITITANSNDAFTTPYAYMHEGIYKIYVKPNTNYLLSWASNNNLSGRVFIFKNGISYGTHVVNVNNDTTKYLLFVTDADTEFITLRFGVATAGNTITYSKIMLNEGSTALPYEPYHAPVTTPIYLPEPIKMVGDEAEYIDYAEQKQHRVRENLFNSSNLTQGVNLSSTDGLIIKYGGRIGINIPIIINGNVTLSYRTENNTNITFMYSLFRNNEFIGRTVNKSSGDTIYGEYGDKIYIVFYIDGAVINMDSISNIMLNPGTEVFPYKPYIEETDLDVTLPALPTLTGTNVLSVGTAVQPSGVEIKGKIKEIN